MADGQLVDKNILKTLVPPNALNSENFQELAGKAYIEELPPGKIVFKAGEVDRKTAYLLDGELTLTDEAGNSTTIRGGTDAAKHPLANSQPRKQTARTKTPMGGGFHAFWPQWADAGTP